MTDKFKRLQELIQYPTESLNTEIKSWLGLSNVEHLAKIIKTSIAIRNNNGGDIIIGFNNDNLKPDYANIPENIEEKYHIDILQSEILKYSSEVFEIEINYPERDNQKFPVITIPSGIKTPIYTKKELINRQGKSLIKKNRLYVRTLNSNNTPSTSEASFKDIERIMEICFGNREYNIAQFLRRNLEVDQIQSLNINTSNLLKEAKFIDDISNQDDLQKFISASNKRFSERIKESEKQLPETGFWDVALIISNGETKYSTNKYFLRLISSLNPDYTGWPIWLVSNQFEEKFQPKHYNDQWETFIDLKNNNMHHIDFIIINPKGKFFQKSAYYEDIQIERINNTNKILEPLKYIDFYLHISNVTEAIAVGLEFAKGMKFEKEKTELFFRFKWTKLRDRELISILHPERHINPGNIAYQDEIFDEIIIPLNISTSKISSYVIKVITSFLRLFNGLELHNSVIDGIVSNVLNRRY